MYQWPVLDEKLINVVIAQLRESLSDKSSSGIIKKTEEKLATYYGSKYCLLFSSATGAMHSLVFALDLAAGDSIVAPVYTFFATASPFAYEGIKVVFCDADEHGQLSVDDLQRRYCSGIKAVVCTHMWGIPCDMAPIRAFCESKGISLIEDCSHAHAARYRDSPVGRFGLASVFSTNQKFITSGEGGFLLTDDRNTYERCLLLAHYNERCQRELTDAKLRQYALTGLGLKYRAHPLAVAILADQLERIAALISHRTKNFNQLARVVDDSPHFNNISPEYPHAPGLYVFPFLARDTETRVRFMDYCGKRNVTSFDVPESTRPLSNEPLFLDCGHGVRNRDKAVTQGIGSAPRRYPGADRFHSLIVKLPLWGHPGDHAEVEAAIDVVTKFPG